MILFKTLSNRWLTWYSKPISEIIVGSVIFLFYMMIGTVFSISVLFGRIYFFWEGFTFYKRMKHSAWYTNDRGFLALNRIVM